MKIASRTLAQIAAVVLVLTGAGAGAAALLLNPEEAIQRPPVVRPPVVRVHRVALGEHRFVVRTHGTVVPRTQTQLVPQVAGTVVAVSPALASGGFFEKNEVLIKLDDRDYRLALTRAEAEVSSARAALALEQAEAEAAIREWKRLGRGEPPPLAKREPQLAAAKARLAAALAARERARLDLERTELPAPYAGRVRSKNVDVGQFVSPGAPVATIYAIDSAEVRLPVPDDQLAYVDLPLDHRGNERRDPGPEVVLHARFAGREHRWRARIVRVEGEIDPRTRVVHAIARVDDPYGRGEDPQRPPLAVGMFVRAEILGRVVHDVAVLPRHAIREDRRVLVVARDRSATEGTDVYRLSVRPVRILRRGYEQVVVGEGLGEGELVCLSPLDVVTDGMRVQPLLEPDASGTAADGEGK